ncbi:hypothetical protein [Sandaracinus amylolyticus]|uniref:hypothetical protein n=1 Tax=Sandaracinus amylolyticus TaxID=927083 RepID=UPI001F208C68|nr:hypothetical protein [Sandaracinus amylolyticus]UJR84022.1 Hypothetical protein I5071_60930 [Sandaracinus amylolyticus]
MRSRAAVAIAAGALWACAPAPDAIDAGADAEISQDAGADAPADARPTPGQAFVGPSVLSETGLYEDLASAALAPGVMPYRVRFELWADGAEKQRWIYLPPGTRIDTRDPDVWVFPIGTRVWKEFRVDGVRVETRFLHKVEADRWENVAYVWRADGSDADARPEGATDVLGTPHDVPAIDDCFTCHRGAIDGLNGVGAIQLATGAPDDFLVHLEAAALVTQPIIPRPAIPGTELEQSALGYLHANCGHCHDSAHPLSHFRALRLRIPVGLVDPLDAPAVRTTVGAEMHHAADGTTIAVVPGEPLSSQLYVRMLHRGDEWDMPPDPTDASDFVDEAGAELVRAWIEGLPATRP